MTTETLEAYGITTIKSADIPPLGKRAFGGIMLGHFFLGDQHRIIVRAPAKLGQIEPMPWNGKYDLVKGALSYNDGMANTKAMAAAGSKLANKILGLEIEGLRDWYLWSQLEAMICFGNSRIIDLPKAEQFRKEWYWTSTQCPHPSASGSAFIQLFHAGYSNWNHKNYNYRGFAVRSLAVI